MLLTSSLLALALQVGPNPNAGDTLGVPEELLNRPPRAGEEGETTDPESIWLAECLQLVTSDPAIGVRRALDALCLCQLTRPANRARRARHRSSLQRCRFSQGRIDVAVVLAGGAVIADRLIECAHQE